MGALIGFVFGYLVGAKAGPEGLEELRKAWEVVSKSEEFQALGATAKGFLLNLLTQGGTGLSSQLQLLTTGNGDLLKMIGAADGGGLEDAWARISESQEFKALLASGTAMLGNVLAQGAAVMSGRTQPGH
jgi:hypothetical protein